MTSTEYKDAPEEELQEKIGDLSKELFELRMQKSTGQLGQTHLIKQVKKEIARIKTLMAERKLEKVAS
ncbi:MAG: 50S ribosomal protein L29 [Gammaproteobacteria bacterium]|nr:50S ribosomal protein L29 [Gammaproteobacteria bacterium]|tara:strand:- start:1339 stop:1542 length:204 start_codon:yes stop_codon:yes gene_type:complete